MFPSELLTANAISAALFLFTVFPVLVYYITTTLFYRKTNSKLLSKIPPTVPYWVPGLFHGLSVASGPPAYFAKVLKQYGSSAPFVVKAGSISLVVVRDAKHAQKILQASAHMTPKALQVRALDKAMDAPIEALLLYDMIRTGSLEDDHNHSARLVVPHKYLTGPSLSSISDVYLATFRRNLSNKMFQFKTWTEIEDMWSFFHNEISKAVMETLFGPAVMKQYPRLVRDFWEFDSNFDGFILGYPQFMMSSAYTARDRLLGNLWDWLLAAKESKEGLEFIRTGDGDLAPTDDRDSVFVKFPYLDGQARAAKALGNMQELNSNTIPPTLWSIVEALRRPALLKRLTVDISHQFDARSETYNMAAVGAMPLVQSLHAEVGRLRMAARVVRRSEEGDFKLDENWTIPSNMWAVMFSHDLALNTKLWAKARPRTIEKPLEEFWAERFLIPEKPNQYQRYAKKQETDTVGTGRFSMEGLDALHIPFEGGLKLGTSRYFAEAVQAATLAILLTEYELEFSEPEDVEQALPPVREIAYGSIKPLHKIRLRIRKRESPNTKRS
ncbi:cytochrome P450 [Massariosphaeria phaeospora]|uniref:Cytochrome P450 n=1 Tax=Massariosphaeria phaeospora TaxID=100035 RepID=A0A7C8M1F2_9PLEO|nr:cytochrome P450 [Massariosphaeria phaeospora]